MTRSILTSRLPLIFAGCLLILSQGCATQQSPAPNTLRPELQRRTAQAALLRTKRAWDALAATGCGEEAAMEYTAATREFIQAMIRSAPPIKWQGDHTMETPDGSLLVRFDPGNDRQTHDARRFDRILVVEQRRPDAVVPSGVRAGLGVPLLARIREEEKVNRRQTEHPNHGQFIPLTGWIEFSSGKSPRATLHLTDPREQPAIQIGRTTLPLAADFRAPAHWMLGKGNLAILAFKGLLDPDRFIPDRGVYLGEPYRPDKVPVILTHGLNSDPHIWKNLATAIMADSDLGARFQIWYFAYPTGEPVLNSARAFRRSLAEVREYYNPKAQGVAGRDLVLVGHSMGGLLSRLLVTDSGDAFYQAYSRKPLTELRFPAKVKDEIRDALFFPPVRGASRAVFIATPHRGSNLADGYVGRLVRSLVSLPAESVRAVVEIVTLHEDALNPLIKNFRNLGAASVDTLSPKHPYYAALEARPVTVPFHSIIGDRGKGGGIRSTDGVVPYESSHLSGAETERFVPYGHSSVERRETVGEILRILHLHTTRGARLPNR